MTDWLRSGFEPDENDVAIMDDTRGDLSSTQYPGNAKLYSVIQNFAEDQVQANSYSTAAEKVQQREQLIYQLGNTMRFVMQDSTSKRWYVVDDPTLVRNRISAQVSLKIRRAAAQTHQQQQQQQQQKPATATSRPSPQHVENNSNSVSQSARLEPRDSPMQGRAKSENHVIPPNLNERLHQHQKKKPPPTWNDRKAPQHEVVPSRTSSANEEQLHSPGINNKINHNFQDLSEEKKDEHQAMHFFQTPSSASPQQYQTRVDSTHYQTRTEVDFEMAKLQDFLRRAAHSEDVDVLRDAVRAEQRLQELEHMDKYPTMFELQERLQWLRIKLKTVTDNMKERLILAEQIEQIKAQWEQEKMALSRIKQLPQPFQWHSPSLAQSCLDSWSGDYVLGRSATEDMMEQSIFSTSSLLSNGMGGPPRELVLNDSDRMRDDIFPPSPYSSKERDRSSRDGSGDDDSYEDEDMIRIFTIAFAVVAALTVVALSQNRKSFGIF